MFLVNKYINITPSPIIASKKPIQPPINGICCNAQRTIAVITRVNATLDFLSNLYCSLILLVIHMLTIEEQINSINIYNPNKAKDADTPTVEHSNIKQATGIKIKVKNQIPIAGIAFVETKEADFFIKFGAIHKANK